MTTAMLPLVKVFFDGGCRPNPGAIEIAVVARGEARILREVGFGTSMDAEWLALNHALSLLPSLGPARFVLLGDAAAVIDQANGAVKCPAASRRHFETFRDLSAAAGTPRVRYVKRSQNLAGIALARLHPR